MNKRFLQHLFYFTRDYVHTSEKNQINVGVAYGNFHWCKPYVNDIHDFVLLQLWV